MKATCIILTLSALICTASIGCTDARQAKFHSLGESHKVELYSGGQRVREWSSTGQVENEEHSDGWYFCDQETKGLVRVSGDVVITRQ